MQGVQGVDIAGCAGCLYKFIHEADALVWHVLVHHMRIFNRCASSYSMVCCNAPNNNNNKAVLPECMQRTVQVDCKHVRINTQGRLPPPHKLHLPGLLANGHVLCS